MVITVQQAAETFGRLSEQDRILAMDFLTRLAQVHEMEKNNKMQNTLTKYSVL